MSLDHRISTRWFVVAVHLGRRYQWAAERRGSRMVLSTPLGMAWAMRKTVRRTATP